MALQLLHLNGVLSSHLSHGCNALIHPSSSSEDNSDGLSMPRLIMYSAMAISSSVSVCSDSSRTESSSDLCSSSSPNKDIAGNLRRPYLLDFLRSLG